MEKWVNDTSNLVFMSARIQWMNLRTLLTDSFGNSGDSCHPMLPYLAQGANSSLEDGAVLGLLLGYMTDKAQLPHVLRLYESMRKSRGEAIVRETFKQVAHPILYTSVRVNIPSEARLPLARRRGTEEAR